VIIYILNVYGYLGDITGEELGYQFPIFKHIKGFFKEGIDNRYSSHQEVVWNIDFNSL
jgi:hypothetical protein